MKNRPVLISVILVILLTAAGIGGMKALIARKRPPARQARAHLGPLVETVTAVKVARQVTVESTGTFQAAATTVLSAQVSGVVAEVAPRLAAGAFFDGGEPLLAFEEADYRIAAAQARAAVTKAESALSQIEANAAVARSEWQNISPAEAPPPLAVLEPQLAEARSALAAARATVEQAELNLQRTRLFAPYPCRVVAKNVELGQYEKSGNPLVTVSSTDRLEVIVPMELADLQWLTIPKGKGGKGSAATVSRRVGGGVRSWQGSVVRLLGEVDPAGKMARLVIGVEGPYQGLPANEQPLLGMFVTAAIKGTTLPDIIVLPRHAVRENDTVWTVAGNDAIAIRRVRIARYEGDDAWIDGGLDHGDRVVLTALSGVADGMKIRIDDRRETR
ncbi:MAG: efflux RND transporter periplasmic adaptor subunit [Thermodesulfobacteriota bacterium]